MKNVASIMVLILIVCTVAGAQTHPNLEGTWRMDKSHSQYPAESAIEVIHQHGDVVDISLTENAPGRPNSPMDIHLTTDGKPSTSIVRGNKFISTTHWGRGRLVTFVQGDRGQHMTEIRELSPDGKRLTVTGYHQDELTKPYYVRVMVRASANPQR